MKAFFTSLILAAISCRAQCTGIRYGNLTSYNPPTLKPFMHVDFLIGMPVNATTIYGITAKVMNRGGNDIVCHKKVSEVLFNIETGNITGEIEGQVVPVGAAFEMIPPATNGTVSVSFHFHHPYVCREDETDNRQTVLH